MHHENGRRCCNQGDGHVRCCVSLDPMLAGTPCSSRPSKSSPFVIVCCWVCPIQIVRLAKVRKRNRPSSLRCMSKLCESCEAMVAKRRVYVG